MHLLELTHLPVSLTAHSSRALHAAARSSPTRGAGAHPPEAGAELVRPPRRSSPPDEADLTPGGARSVAVELARTRPLQLARGAAAGAALPHASCAQFLPAPPGGAHPWSPLLMCSSSSSVVSLEIDLFTG
ncbi:hypothetical protein C2845_PM14G04590 [Panicum miliaceum]|uniref:Uncharacterized protein n=1 Tax=Panicum miliaceum TaxID=4540 RepID=A0A3L6PP77_PANMI|nr:hypothetical protein C2845_PM14G04590 [Panicum miliaceum]